MEEKKETHKDHPAHGGEPHKTNSHEHHAHKEIHKIRHKHPADYKIPKSKLTLENIFFGIAILLAVVIMINIFLTFSLNKQLNDRVKEAVEASRPAQVQITTLTNSRCPDCFDLAPVLEAIRSSGLNITSEKLLEFDSPEGKELIKKHDLTTVPSFVVTGEIEKANIDGLEVTDDALLLLQAFPPYTDAATGQIHGRIQATKIIDSGCEKCSDLSGLMLQIRGAGLNIFEETEVEFDSPEGKELIEKYNIQFAPALILSEDAELYALMQEAWPAVGTVEPDGAHVMRLVYPPFVNLSSSEVRGIVTITYLEDSSCEECYSTSVHEQILTNPQGFAVRLDKKISLDISSKEGKELIDKYSILNVPTIILSRDVSDYPSSSALGQFFSTEEDGSMIFRRLQAVGIYKNLETGEVIDPSQQSSVDQADA